MKVCHLINVLSPGGAQSLVLDLVRSTDADVTVCSLEANEAVVSDLREAGARVKTFDESFKFDPRALAKLVSFFRGESFDVLHCHLPYAQTLGRLVAQISDIDAVVSTQHNFPSMYHPITRTLDRMTISLDDATVAVSETAEREHTGDSHKFPEIGKQWTTIYNAVAVDDIHAAATTDGSIREELGLDDEFLREKAN